MTEADIQHISIASEEVEQIIETHISWVVITRVHVYKIKRPVQFSFVDFSTPQKRKHYCLEEIRLNRRLTDGIYLGVCGIVKSGKNFVIIEDIDHALDYAVKMTRQDINLQMHGLLEKNQVNEDQIRELARMIAHFHKNLNAISLKYDPDELKNTFKDIESVRTYINESIGEPYGKVISQAIDFSNGFIEEYRNVFQDRIMRGMIRDCHGDLHSGNIFLSSPPVIFDCIEFNPAFREIDLLYEIAFFCMDLDSFGREDLKEYFLEEYKIAFPEVTEKNSDRLIFVYYKLLRANIRSKVLALKLCGEHRNQDDLHDTDELKRYIRLMKKYLVQLEEEIGN